MTPKHQLLWIRLRCGIERDGEAPIVVAEITEFHVTRMKPPGGRPKATAKHAAVVMAFRFELLRFVNKPFKAGGVVAKQFGYRGEREVRRIIKSKQNPLRGTNGQWIILTGVNGSGELAIVTEHPDAVVESDTTIRVDGRGWAWTPGAPEAAYGHLRGGGMLQGKETPEVALSPGGDMGQNYT